MKAHINLGLKAISGLPDQGKELRNCDVKINRSRQTNDLYNHRINPNNNFTHVPNFAISCQTKQDIVSLANPNPGH